MLVGLLLMMHESPFPLQAMLRSESVAHWIQRSFQTTLPAGEHWLCCVGCCYEVETPANACDTGRQTASYFVLGKSVKLQQCRLATAAICRIQVCGLRNRG